MNKLLNKTCWGEHPEAEEIKTDGIDIVNRSHQRQRQYGKDPKPSWVGVGVMSFVCMAVGFLLGVVI